MIVLILKGLWINFGLVGSCDPSPIHPCKIDSLSFGFLEALFVSSGFEEECILFEGLLLFEGLRPQKQWSLPGNGEACGEEPDLRPQKQSGLRGTVRPA